MKFSRNASRMMWLALALVTTLVAVGGVFAQDPVVLVTGRQMSSSDIPTLDPSLAEDVPSVQVIAELFPELIRLNEEQVIPEPGMATYTVSEDGLTYTFSITPEVPWVRYNADSGAVEALTAEDGSPLYVTAQDFAYGMLRTMNPETAAPYQYVLTPWVAGAADYGSADPATADLEALRAAVGITVVDEYTLEVTASNASAVTPLIFALWITTAQPQIVIDEFADFWIDPENIATYGPFALKEWVRGDGGSLTMIKNPFFPGSNAIPQSQIDEVQFRFLDEEAQLTEFEAGTLDVAEAPAAQIDRILSDPALSAAYFNGPGSCTYYYGFNSLVAPFDDARARRAFSMAIDRQAITENVVGAGEIPAQFFALPNLVAAPTAEQYPDQGVQTDVEMAQALWQEYLTDTGADPASFQITIFHNESSLHSNVAQAVQQQWSQTLGVDVQIATADFATYLDTRGDYPVFRAAWCFDYPDAHNFYYDTPFHSDLLEENDTHWSNAAFDALVDEAFVADSVEARRDLYAQAEQILVYDDAAIAPIYHYVTDSLTAPGITRTYSLITREYYEKWSVNR
ncbi:MAG: peptide ABC transporter substrate-binding protein [bacterium]|nr:peptide ABC transporter substrate-binding protein [bacterium]